MSKIYLIEKVIRYKVTADSPQDAMNCVYAHNELAEDTPRVKVIYGKIDVLRTDDNE